MTRERRPSSPTMPRSDRARAELVRAREEMRAPPELEWRSTSEQTRGDGNVIKATLAIFGPMVGGFAGTIAVGLQSQDPNLWFALSAGASFRLAAFLVMTPWLVSSYCLLRSAKAARRNAALVAVLSVAWGMAWEAILVLSAAVPENY